METHNILSHRARHNRQQQDTAATGGPVSSPAEAGAPCLVWQKFPPEGHCEEMGQCHMSWACGLLQNLKGCSLHHIARKHLTFLCLAPPFFQALAEVLRVHLPVTAPLVTGDPELKP
jgi:hypothetical protein